MHGLTTRSARDLYSKAPQPGLPTRSPSIKLPNTRAAYEAPNAPTLPFARLRQEALGRLEEHLAQDKLTMPVSRRDELLQTFRSLLEALGHGSAKGARR